MLLNTPCSKVLNVIIHTRGAEIEDAKNHGVFLSSRALEKHYDILRSYAAFLTLISRKLHSRSVGSRWREEEARRWRGDGGAILGYSF